MVKGWQKIISDDDDDDFIDWSLLINYAIFNNIRNNDKSKLA